SLMGWLTMVEGWSTMVRGPGGVGMDFRLFGPVEVHGPDGPIDIGPQLQRTVLVALAVDAGRPVSTETLIDRVWGDAPPQRVRETLYAYITRLRQALGQGSPVVRRSSGYVLDVAPDSVDLQRFRALVERAGGRQCPDVERVTLLREALGLRRGEALAGL